MPFENKRRHRRIPLSSEELAHFIAFRRSRELRALLLFKKTGVYRVLNVFLILGFFLYCELICCYLGPSYTEQHFAAGLTASYGDRLDKRAKPVVAELTVKSNRGPEYTFVVNDFIAIPKNGTMFLIGKDFLLRKPLKGRFNGEDRSYRIFRASPVLFLSIFTGIITVVGFSYNLNENLYSLAALAFLNLCTVTGILCI